MKNPAAVFALALFLCLGLPPCAAAQNAQSALPLTVQDIYRGPLAEQPPGGLEWSPDGTRLTYIAKDGALMQVNAATGAQSVLIPSQKMAPLMGPPPGERDRDHRARYGEPSYFWVPDSQHLLFDSKGILWFYDLQTGTGLQLAATGAGSGDDPKFSPDARYISYIKNNDLCVRELSHSGMEIPLTKPVKNILNGGVDWVYEEELDVRSNYFWSPSSRQIAYMQMDETDVPEYPLTDWIPTHPTVAMQRYPQPGDPNPRVRIGVVSAGGGKTRWIKVPLDEGNGYIPRFGWVDAKTLWIETLSRDQKTLTLYFADASGGPVKPVLVQSDSVFLDASYDIRVSGGRILFTSWRDGHNHIYLYSYDSSAPLSRDATLVRQLTSGDWNVSSIQAIDPRTETLYYLSNEGDPRQQQVWAIKLDGTGKHELRLRGGWHDPIFSPNAKLFADTASSTGTPPVLSLCREETRCAPVWKMPPSGKEILTPIALTLRAADGKTTLYGSLLLPPGRTAPASVPLILNPYGGPHAQVVTDQWNGTGLLFDNVLAEHGFAVLHVDNRGTGGRSRAFQQVAYHTFGPVQLADQLAALNQVLAIYPQLDPKRLGWWGWSWGGTFTLYAMTHSDRFRAGVSVAPVTDWRNYDSIYTERYLGQPDENPRVYQEDSVVNSAKHLHGRLLLVHGTGDDNVHMSNSIQFIQQLIEAGIPYDLQLYPRKTHSISGPTDRTHLFNRILAEFETWLMPVPSGTRAGQKGAIE